MASGRPKGGKKRDRYIEKKMYTRREEKSQENDLKEGEKHTGEVGD